MPTEAIWFEYLATFFVISVILIKFGQKGNAPKTRKFKENQVSRVFYFIWVLGNIFEHHPYRTSYFGHNCNRCSEVGKKTKNINFCWRQHKNKRKWPFPGIFFVKYWISSWLSTLIQRFIDFTQITKEIQTKVNL